MLTTTYTGSTEGARARRAPRPRRRGPRLLRHDGTRLHAKAWLFHRQSGFSTAYIGSSNLTHSAQVTGLEWNVRVSGARNPDVVDKVAAVFESYWNSGDFVPVRRRGVRSARRRARRRRRHVLLSPIELRPEPFQERLLEQIALVTRARPPSQPARVRDGHRQDRDGGHRLRAAPGAAAARAAALRRPPRGDPRAEPRDVSPRAARPRLRRAVGGRPASDATSSTSSRRSRASTPPASRDLDPHHFDVVIVDEFHHAAAPSYRALLDHVHAGRAARPDGHAGAQRRPAAPGAGSTTASPPSCGSGTRSTSTGCRPSSYFGIHDGLDLRDVPWRRGRGYDVEGADEPAHRERRLGAPGGRRSSIARVDDLAPNARARLLRERRARAVHGAASSARPASGRRRSGRTRPRAERQQALEDLAARRINVVFSVDLFNEGVDVPVVDTLLLLRPTDSPTLFLQQLGRGLRKSHGKTACTVLDFVGHHRKEFRFDRRFRALLGGSRRDLQRADRGRASRSSRRAATWSSIQVAAGDRAREHPRRPCRRAGRAKVEELRAMARDGAERDPRRVSAGDRARASRTSTRGRSPGRTCEPTPDSRCCRRVRTKRRCAARADGCSMWTIRCGSTPTGGFSSRRRRQMSRALPERDRRLLRMLVASIADSALTTTTTLEEACALALGASAGSRGAARAAGRARRAASTICSTRSTRTRTSRCGCTRATRASRSSRRSASARRRRVTPWQTGVYWAKQAKADLLAFTLDKTSGQFSPTTRYRDYAISRELMHWESQSVTTRRQRDGAALPATTQPMGTSIMLFARLRTDDRAFWFLGPATYVKHESETPMAVTWRLKHPLPGDLFEQFAAAVA